MLTDEQVEEYYQIIRDRVDRVNEKYLRKVGEQIQKIGKMNPSSINRIAQMREYQANAQVIKRELAKAMGQSEETVQELFDRALKEEFVTAAFVAVAKGETLGKLAENEMLKTYVAALARQTMETFENFSRTTVTSGTYKDVVDDAIDAVTRGVTDYNSAIRDSMRTLGGDGLTVEYESGWHMRMDSAIRMNLLDGTRQIAMKAQEMIGEEIGADGVELSAHPFSAKDHEEAQGRQYTMENYQAMQSARKFYDVDGKEYDAFKRPITQWNCRHFASSILIGISQRRYTDEQLEQWKKKNHEGCEIDGKHYTIYQASQLMRKMETEVRRQKDIATLAQASGDDTLRREAQAKILNIKKKYAEVSEKSGLRERRDKMVVNSYRETRAEKAARKMREGMPAKTQARKPDIQFFAKKTVDKIPSVQLPKAEYANVMSEISTHLTNQQRNSKVFTKAIGNHLYTVENNGDFMFRIVGKKKLDMESYGEFDE